MTPLAAIITTSAVCAASFISLLVGKKEMADTGVVSAGWVVMNLNFLYFCLPPLCYLITPEASEGPRNYFDYGLDLYATIAVVGAVGGVCVYLGYIATPARRPHLRLRQWFCKTFANSDAPSVACGALVLSWTRAASLLLQERAGIIHYGGAISVAARNSSSTIQLQTDLQNLGIVANAALVYLILSKSIKSPLLKSLIYITISFHVLLAFTAGGSGPLLHLAFMVVVYYMYYTPRRKALRLSGARLLAIGLTAFLAATTAKVITRDIAAVGGQASFFGVLAALHGQLPAQSLGSVVHPGQFATEAIRSISGAEPLAAILVRERTGDRPKLWGATYKNIIAAFVPRYLDPDKPDIALGSWFTDTYWRFDNDVSKAGAGTQGTNFMFVGELVMNFGLAGVIPGMFVIGILVRFLADTVLSRGQASQVIDFAFTGSMLFDVLYYNYSIAGYVSGFVRSAAMVYIALASIFVIANIITPRKAAPITSRLLKSPRFV